MTYLANPSRRQSATLIVIMLVGLVGAREAAAQSIRTVSLSNETLPGTAAGTTVSGYYEIALNESGRVAFRAFITDPTLIPYDSRDVGIWSEGEGPLELVARYRQQAPGLPSGSLLTSIVPQTLSDDGSLVFKSYYGPIGLAGHAAVYKHDAGGLQLVARRDQSPPGVVGGGQFIETGMPALNDAGEAAFTGMLYGTGVTSANNQGIWVQRGDDLTLLVRTGQAAPGLAPGVVFSSGFEQGDKPALNRAGTSTFFARLSGAGIGPLNDGSIWMDAGGTLSLVAQEGRDAPGAAMGHRFLQLSPPLLNESGQAVFRASLIGTGVNGLNDQGIWSASGDTVTLRVRTGQQAPGLPAGTQFSILNSAPSVVLNVDGDVFFSAAVTGATVTSNNNEGLWLSHEEGLSLVAREGDAAPGAPGTFFGALRTSASTGLNDAGQLGFSGSLTGPGVDASNDVGIWATDRAGTLRLIARKGEQLEIAPGDFRTISRLWWTGTEGNGTGALSAFNNRGEIAFYAEFTDGVSGVFVSSLATIPEPSAAALAALGISCGLTHVRRRQA